MSKSKKKEFKSKHNNRTVYRETYKGTEYIRCKYSDCSVDLGTDYFTYNAELYKILRSTKVGVDSDRRCKRARFRIWNSKDGKQRMIYASHLAYGCYHGFIKYATLASDIEKFRAYMRDNNLVVDHIDDNYHNNTEHNLSVMLSEDNNRKKDIISKIKEPSACIVSYVDDTYRVRLFLRTNIKHFLQEYDTSPERRAAILAKTVEGGHPNLGWFEEHYICYNFNELLACLRREVLKHREHTLPLKEGKRGSKLWINTPSNEYWGDDIKYALELQSELAAADWSDAKPVLALHRADRDAKYFEYLKGRVKGLKSAKLPAGKYTVKEASAE